MHDFDLFRSFFLIADIDQVVYNANIPRNVKCKSPCVGNDDDKSNFVASYLYTIILICMSIYQDLNHISHGNLPFNHLECCIGIRNFDF
jgi:hypothetical protein